MNVLEREKLRNLRQNRIHETVYFFVCRAQCIVKKPFWWSTARPIHNLLARTRFVVYRLWGTRKIRIGGYRCEAMPWYINFGHDIHKTIFSVLYQFFYVVLCVKPAIIARFICCRRNKITESSRSVNTPGSNLG